MFSELSHSLIIRPGSSSGGVTTTARQSADFLIDGESLLRILVREDGGYGDFMGVLVRGYPEQNADVASQLVGLTDPSFDTGRVLLYVCPECGDIGCGAYSAIVSVASGEASWSDFAYENGYEDPRPLENIGPFVFDTSRYKAAIASASAL